MNRKSKENQDIIDFIIQEIDKHPRDIAAFTAAHFSIKRITANRYLQKLIKNNVLIASGNTHARQYKLKDFIDQSFILPVKKDTEEHLIWMNSILPLLQDLKPNVLDICQYGVTEMVNNVIDHSESEKLTIVIKRNVNKVCIKIVDLGIGIFEKIRANCGLLDPRQALLELSKGKLTTDPKHHTGEGVFFTSRMFDEFSINSGKLLYTRSKKTDDDWLIEIDDVGKEIQGTVISMEIHSSAEQTTKEIFDKYTDDEYRFSRTHIPIVLAKYGSEQLVSRSQAKRILMHFEKFSEILLDFKGVDQIGPAFADEIFRVFKNAHPEIKLIPANTTLQIDAMIKNVEKNTV